MAISNNNLYNIFEKSYVHPSIILWRAVEAREVSDFLKTITIETPIFDLGCGDGKIANVIFDKKVDVGLDIFFKDVQKAKILQVYDKTLVGDACHLGIKNNYFGTVFSNCVIEHILDNEAVLSEAARVLKDKGLFIFTVPSDKFGEYLFFYTLFNKLGLHKLAKWYVKKRNRLLNHFHGYSPQLWASRADKYGFELIYSKYFLSKSATQVWDLMAFILFIFQKINIFKNTLFSKWLLRKTKRFRTKVYRLIIYNYYLQQEKLGAGLLIVLKKR
jgi:SAM-dependent methyltransferase